MKYLRGVGYALGWERSGERAKNLLGVAQRWGIDSSVSRKNDDPFVENKVGIVGHTNRIKGTKTLGSDRGVEFRRGRTGVHGGEKRWGR